MIAVDIGDGMVVHYASDVVSWAETMSSSSNPARIEKTTLRDFTHNFNLPITIVSSPQSKEEADIIVSRALVILIFSRCDDIVLF